MGVNRRQTANSKTKPNHEAPYYEAPNFETIMGLVESATDDINNAVDKGLANISTEVRKAVEAAFKKLSNEGHSTVSAIAPRIPLNAVSTPKSTPPDNFVKRRPEDRAPAPRTTHVNSARPVYLLKESLWRLYMKELRSYRFSILLGIMLVYFIAPSGLYTFLRWAGARILRLPLETLCSGEIEEFIARTY